MLLNLIKNKNLIAPLILLFLCIVTFSNSLENPFMMDDLPLIVHNHLKTSDFLQLSFFTESGDGLEEAKTLYFRPITHLIYLFSVYLFGQNFEFYHMFNLILLYMCCISLYELMKISFSDVKLAFLVSALFCIHPINGVLVNYITASSFLALILFVFWSLLFFIKWVGFKKNKIFYVLSVVCFFMALLCHEIAIAFPLYFITFLYFTNNQILKKSIFYALPYGLVLLMYLIFRLFFASLSSGTIGHLSHFNFNLFEYVASFFNLLIYYMRNLVFPDSVALLWATPIVRDYLLIWIFCFIGFVFLLGFLFCSQFKEKVFILGLSWFVIGLAPVTLASLSRPNLGFLIEPHWMLFSTVGFVMMLSDVFLRLFHKSRKPTMIVVMVILIFVLYIKISREYNRLWYDEKKYCRYLLQMSPQMELPVFWLAFSYLKDREFNEAKYYFKKTLTGRRSDWQSYANLGFIEDVLGNKKAAKKYYFKVLSLNPKALDSYNNLAALYIEENELEKAKVLLEKALYFNNQFLPAKLNLDILNNKRLVL